MAKDDSLQEEALMTTESATGHVSTTHCIDVNFNFPLFIFRQATDEVWFIHMIVSAATTPAAMFMYHISV